jgi:polysaccharide export outer membrane protein
MNFKNLTILGVCALAMASCSAPSRVIYVKDADKIPAEILSQKQTITEAVLGPGDLLNIRVYASDMAAVAPFNKGQYLTADGTVSTSNLSTSSGGGGGSSETSTEYFLVDTQGYIDMPMLGKLLVTGKTKEEFSNEIRDMIYPKYVTVMPTVEVRLMNFKVTVLGSVGSVGQIHSNNDRLNILEAIALAGDIQLTGDRDNVLLYRTNSDGSREIHRLNLHDRNILLSPYFNLQQNDVLYVQPNRSARQGAWQLHQGWTTTLSVVAGAASLASVVLGVINLSD